MTKIQITIKTDTLTKQGREIGIVWTTDNDNINSFIRSPRAWHRRYPANVQLKTVKADFLVEAVPLIQRAQKNNKGSLIGEIFEVNI